MPRPRPPVEVPIGFVEVVDGVEFMSASGANRVYTAPSVMGGGFFGKILDISAISRIIETKCLHEPVGIKTKYRHEVEHPFT